MRGARQDVASLVCHSELSEKSVCLVLIERKRDVGGCGQVVAVWGQETQSWDAVVMAGLSQDAEELENQQVSAPCWSISWRSGSSRRVVGGVGGLPFFLNPPSLPSGCQVPTAPCVFTAPPRGRHPACSRDGHCRVPRARGTQGLPRWGSKMRAWDREVCSL